MFDPLTVRIGGPLAHYREQLCHALLARGYTPLSVGNLMRLAAHLSRWLEAHGRGIATLGCAQALQDFLRHRRKQGYTHFLSARALTPITRHFKEAGIVASVRDRFVPTGELDAIIEKFTQYLLRERGLTASSASSYSTIAREFLRLRFAEQPIHLQQLTASDTTSFVLRASRCYCIGTTKYVVTALRSFLRYLFLQQRIAIDLSGAVPAVAGWRLAGLPKALQDVQVRQLLGACDCRRHIGRRDYAALLLMVRMGLRRGEVAALELDDIDWFNGELLVRGKARREERLPLPSEVGAALARYLRQSRQRTSSRRLLLSSRAPCEPLSSGAITAIVYRACQRTGMAPVGAHRLRHTAATQMLRAGASLDEIAQVLRHCSHDTTAIYAKVDRRALRPLARPWPVVSP